MLGPLLPELAGTEEPIALTGAYSSADNLLRGAALRELLDGAGSPVDAAMAGI